MRQHFISTFGVWHAAGPSARQHLVSARGGAATQHRTAQRPTTTTRPTRSAHMVARPRPTRPPATRQQRTAHAPCGPSHHGAPQAPRKSTKPSIVDVPVVNRHLQNRTCAGLRPRRRRQTPLQQHRAGPRQPGERNAQNNQLGTLPRHHIGVCQVYERTTQRRFLPGICKGGGIILYGDYLPRESFGRGKFRHPCKSQKLELLPVHHMLHVRKICHRTCHQKHNGS